jgi:hypothetical protein
MQKTSILKVVRGGRANDFRVATRAPASISSNMKARQSVKIKELKHALVEAGFLGLDQQAAALGLCRSTTWAVLKGNHKSSGLSATIVKRMLASPQLPQSARLALLEYVEEKSAGAYGHNKGQRRAFRARIEQGNDIPIWDGFAVGQR